MLHTLKLLLPALIPSWNFFDVIAPSPRIEFTLLHSTQDTPDHWQEFRPRPQHITISTMLKRLFWNPDWNESLFLVSCAERLAANPTEHSQQAILTRITDSFQRQEITAPYIQFRLVFLHRQGDHIAKHITYMSPAYPYERTPHS